MRTAASNSDLPNVPAVYAMFGGRDRNSYVAYVGMADALRIRLVQHLARRDSSATTGMSAVSLNPDRITRVDWWEGPEFAQRHILEAAELVAFDVLKPALRSRGGIRAESARLYADGGFRQAMVALFEGPPAGRLLIPTLADALERIAALERRLAGLEAHVRGGQDRP